MKDLFFTIVSLFLATSFGSAQDGEIVLDTIKSNNALVDQVDKQVEVRPSYPGM